MGYTMANGRWAESRDLTLKADGAEAASTNGGWIEIGDQDCAVLELDVTAASGTTPTLDVAVETAKDDAGTYSRQVGTFTQQTGVATERKSFVGLDRFIRYVSTIGGTTPSFTYSIAGETK